MHNERTTRSTGRLAPLAQVALAALVAGSLLTFSTIAFRTAFDDPARGRGVTVSSPRTEAAAPVVLPTPPKEGTDAHASDTDDVVATNAPGTTNLPIDSDDQQSSSGGKDRDEASEPRVALPWPGSSRTLSGYDDDDAGEHGKAKGHGNGNGKGKHDNEGHEGHSKGKHDDEGHEGHDEGHEGHEGHGHKNKGHGHSRGRKH